MPSSASIIDACQWVQRATHRVKSGRPRAQDLARSSLHRRNISMGSVVVVWVDDSAGDDQVFFLTLGCPGASGPGTLLAACFGPTTEES